MTPNPARQAPASGIAKRPRPDHNAGRGARPLAHQRKKPKTPTALAYLNCNSWPWSVVYLDGQKLRGNTPHFAIPVRPGRHVLRFVHPELGMLKQTEITVEAGETKTVAVTLSE